MKSNGYIKTKLSILLCFMYFLFNSCSEPSPASKITDISDLKAEIDIYQKLTDDNDNSISIVLHDRNDKIFGNDSVNIWVNGQKAEYRTVQGLYYIKNYLYHTEKVSPENNKYEFQIQLANGKKFFMASIPSLKESSSRNIIYKEEAPLTSDFTIQWSGLYDVNVLYLSKSVKIITKEESNVETYAEQTGDTIKIGPSGSYTLKKEKFSKPGETLSILSFEFTAEKSGTVNPQLLKGSTININGNHDEQVHFK
ncbi:hypothetical protein [Chryseobacterium vrystaatense]|uniref:DUF4493 domain-containing protein n=1 Tax=Chryseobacterium vrystaatense TaxID=307480 RepID=A0ABR4UHT5_9FLAO|nr:hypothetical protein [Chryseobacterium vrystaatense]KFF24157.1 hypothetical protein IW16_22620 [Chryseobacterium vrystaatense]